MITDKIVSFIIQLLLYDNTEKGNKWGVYVNILTTLRGIPWYHDIENNKFF